MSTSRSENTGRHIELMLEKALKNDNSFVMWSSMNFDYQQDVNLNSNTALSNIMEASMSSQLLELQVRPYSTIYFVKVGPKINPHF
ncbi:hypothetical protein DPMN_193306 [Dreissena polymorpha]|uniref:Uncharacterized protein n=1 Tax=Dreissena polymorpha TaxID=45954 RepID=A0A9D4BF25_DREPO|nr:hypothetical protein DPMN_193306 [Dreissena polymorpha]